MKRFKQVETKLLLFLISGILLLSIGFVSCGTGPQTKTTVPDRGAYAVDFSAAPSELGFIDLGRSINSMAGLTGFTVEAWVKPNTTTLTGGVFSRSSDPPDGIVLSISPSNTPLFAMVISSTVYSVTSTTTLSNDVWTHIAGVLTGEDQSSGLNDCSIFGAGVPHLAIYINGSLNNCATTSSNYPAAFSYNERIGRPHTNFSTLSIEMEINTKLNAVIDEVRFWKVARTQSQIQQCMSQELGGVSGTCMKTSDLIGYWMLNEGAGSTIIDSSGYQGNGGTKDYCEPGSGCESGGTSILWDGGWTTGYPF